MEIKRETAADKKSLKESSQHGMQRHQPESTGTGIQIRYARFLEITRLFHLINSEQHEKILSQVGASR